MGGRLLAWSIAWSRHNNILPLGPCAVLAATASPALWSNFTAGSFPFLAFLDRGAHKQRQPRAQLPLARSTSSQMQCKNRPALLCRLFPTDWAHSAGGFFRLLVTPTRCKTPKSHSFMDDLLIPSATVPLERTTARLLCHLGTAAAAEKKNRSVTLKLFSFFSARFFSCWTDDRQSFDTSAIAPVLSVGPSSGSLVLLWRRWAQNRRRPPLMHLVLSSL